MNTINLDELDLGTRVRLTRVIRKWSQEQVAALAKTKQEDVSRLERNLKVDDVGKQKILRALGIAEKEG